MSVRTNIHIQIQYDVQWKLLANNILSTLLQITNVLCSIVHMCMCACVHVCICTVVIKSTIPKKRALNAGDRVRTHVPCAYSQLHAVISTIILYATFLVTAKTSTDISLRKSSTDCRHSI